MPVRRQREDIFPIPWQTSTPQRPEFSRTVLPQAKVYLAIDDLRSIVTDALLLMNLGAA